MFVRQSIREAGQSYASVKGQVLIVSECVCGGGVSHRRWFLSTLPYLQSIILASGQLLSN